MTEWFNKLLDYGPYTLLYPSIMPNYTFKYPQLEAYHSTI